MSHNLHSDVAGEVVCVMLKLTAADNSKNL